MEIKYKRLKYEIYEDLTDSMKDFIKLKFLKFRRGYNQVINFKGVIPMKTFYIKSLRDEMEFLTGDCLQKTNFFIYLCKIHCCMKSLHVSHVNQVLKYRGKQFM